MRVPYNADGTLQALNPATQVVDSLGGRAFYMGRLELEFPVSSSLRSMGLRPSAFIDIGSEWNITRPQLSDVVAICSPITTTSGLAAFTSPVPNCSKDYNNHPHDPTQFTATPGFKELFLGNSSSPRLAIGIGVNWVSPFGPLRLDLAKAILKQQGDQPKLFSFNVGTSF